MIKKNLYIFSKTCTMFFNGSGLARIENRKNKMKTTYYRHSSGKSNQIGQKYCALIKEITLDISDIKIGVEGQYYAYMPDGVICMKADSPESVLKYLKQSLEKEGWVIDKSIAQKRAEKLVELRSSGALKMAGKNFRKEDYDRCMSIVLAISEG